MTQIAHVNARLRALADHLQAEGWLRSAAWRRAVEAVPRHVFIPAAFRPIPGHGPTTWEPVEAKTVGEKAWLDMMYRDETWVTQLDQGISPHDVQAPIVGEPSSSSTLPALVVWMLEELNIHDGMRVLEIGTGTGYSTALLCERLGSHYVTSMEIDPVAAHQAATALHGLGYAPSLVVGDGQAGYPPNALYERIIATCSIRHLPASWLRQAKPGAIILATLTGWLYGFALAKLAVTSDGVAEGTFLPGTTSFMIARPHAPRRPTVHRFDLLDADPGRPTPVGSDILDDWTGRFIAQLAAPDVQHVKTSINGGPLIDLLTDDQTQSAARLTRADDGSWMVHQHGTHKIWDRIEDAITGWKTAGKPPASSFSIRIHGREQAVWLTNQPDLMWTVMS